MSDTPSSAEDPTPATSAADREGRSSRSSSFRRGLRLGIPVLAGYVPVGAAFGVVAVSAGFTVPQVVVCSALVLAGAGQFIAVQLLSSGVGGIATVLATGVVNLRYVLFSATMAPHLQETPRSMQLPLAFTLTDETFGINVTDAREGHADDWSMLGVGVISWAAWVFGSALGAIATSLVTDPGRFGVSYAMPAMFTALLVAQIVDRRHAAVALLAAVLALALTPVLPAGWPAIAGAIGAATVATVVTR